jgi:hypothetical protein
MHYVKIMNQQLFIYFVLFHKYGIIGTGKSKKKKKKYNKTIIKVLASEIIHLQIISLDLEYIAISSNFCIVANLIENI